MASTKKILMIALLSLSLFGCGTKITTDTPAKTEPVQSTSAYPNPIQQTLGPSNNSIYPEPGVGQTAPQIITTPDYYVTKLVVPTPAGGKIVVTGQLLVGGKGGKPFITTLYLAPTIPPSTPTYPPMIAFSETTDQIALMDVNTGQFLFTNVEPGQYALIIWTPFGSNPVVDEKDNTIMFSVKTDEVKDLGIITIK